MTEDEFNSRSARVTAAKKKLCDLTDEMEEDPPAWLMAMAHLSAALLALSADSKKDLEEGLKLHQDVVRRHAISARNEYEKRLHALGVKHGV